jgi:hypothetical protein
VRGRAWSVIVHGLCKPTKLIIIIISILVFNGARVMVPGDGTWGGNAD